MRISLKNIKLITQVFKKYLGRKIFDLRLYGSRLDDNAKGGDIDLLLIVSDKYVEQLNFNKHELLAKLKQEIGDQKIDLTICTNKIILSSSFLNLAYSKSIPLTEQKVKKEALQLPQQ